MRVFFFVSSFSLYLSSPWYLCCSPLAVHPGELSLCVCVCVARRGMANAFIDTSSGAYNSYSLQLTAALALALVRLRVCACMRVCVSHPPFECNCNWQGLPCPGEWRVKGGGGVQSYSAHILNLYRAWAFFGLPLTTLCACVCVCVRYSACVCMRVLLCMCACVCVYCSLFLPLYSGKAKHTQNNACKMGVT